VTKKYSPVKTKTMSTSLLQKEKSTNDRTEIAWREELDCSRAKDSLRLPYQDELITQTPETAACKGIYFWTSFWVVDQITIHF